MQGEAFRVLVVDDDEDSREALRQLLELEGYDARSASSGAAALEAVWAYPPSAALLDFWLPDMDGAELAARIRSIPGGGAPHMAVLTGCPMEMLPADAPFERRFRKPIDVGAVLGYLDGLRRGDGLSDP